MKVEIVNKQSTRYPVLAGFIEKHNLLFNSAAWLNNYDLTALTQCAILNNNNEVIGCFIYYTFKKASFNFVISPPYAPNIELFYVNPSESVVGRNTFNKEISDLLADYFISLNKHYVNINLPETIIDTQPFTWKGFTSRLRYSYIIHLSKSKEELWDNLSSEKRKSVNKAIKDELEVKETTDKELVYSLVIKSLDRNGKSKNIEIIRKILFSFSKPQNSYSFVAYHKNVPIGTSFCVINKNKAMYLFGGFDSENKHHGAGVSCMWQSILKAKDLNLQYFDFEGSMNETIERYFREFGGDMIQYACVEKINPILKTMLTLTKRNTL